MKKKLMIISLAAVALTWVAWTATQAQAQKKMAAETWMEGTIIDNTCSGANKANLDKFIKTHTKECALMPACQASGYALYSGKKLYEFDKDSTAKIVDFLQVKENTLNVKVKVVKTGMELSLVSIENMKAAPMKKAETKKMK